MFYHALARKYRPATFAEVVGQKHVTGTLRAALRKDKLSHAYLFAGPRGCGKTTVARLLAKALNCQDSDQGDPCGKCETCLSIAAGSYLDVLEIDAASHTGVDNIRDLRDMAQYSPTKGGNRIFIIDEVHMLSKGAFNALLKILEEPPARVYFFFATTEPTKVPRTILSRCQRFDFRLLSRQELAGRLEEIAAAEKVELDPSGLRVVVSLAEGSLRDALSILDQLIAGCEGVIDEQRIVELFGLVRSEVYAELNEAILARDPAQALRLLDRLATSGESLDAFAQGIVVNFRNLLLIRTDPELATAVDLSPEQVATLAAQAEKFASQDLLALIDRAVFHYERIHRSSQPRILLEAALVELTLFESRVLLSDLVQRLTQLSGGGGPGEGGAAGQPSSQSGPGATADGRGDYGSLAGAGKPAAEAVAEPGPGRSPSGRGAAAAAATITGWTGFIQVLLDAQPGLASCLMEGLPSLDQERGRLVVAFPADKAFQLDRLNREREILTERVIAHWGRPLRVDLVASDAVEEVPDRERIRREVAPNEREILQNACREDRPLSDLVELLQGVPLSDQERRHWLEDESAARGPESGESSPDPAGPVPGADT